MSRDVYSVINSSSYLIRNYLYIGRDYEKGIEELEKLILFCYGCLLTLPKTPSNYLIRRLVQSQIVKDKSVLIQYQQHILGGLKSVFFPAQLMTIVISNIFF